MDLERQFLRAGAFVLVALLAAAPAAASQVTVGAGSTLDLGSARLDLRCADLVLGGSFFGGSGVLARARDVSIQPGGSLEAGSAMLNLRGDWTNAGSFDPGTGKVAFLDGCGRASATLWGSSSFFELELRTGTGKLYAFEAGSTTTVTGFLLVSGAAGDPLRIVSSAAGSEAFLDLQGGQLVSFVSVQDNHAIGAPIQAGGQSASLGNTSGWTFSASVPALTLLGGGLLVLAVLWSGRRALAPRPGP